MGGAFMAIEGSLWVNTMGKVQAGFESTHF
jgi:hypothetical protein